MRRSKVNPKIGKVEVDFKDDVLLRERLFRFILLAYELEGKTDEEVEALQRKFLDSC